MNKADKVKQKLIKEVVIPSLLGVLIALLFLLAVVKPTSAKPKEYPMTATVYSISDDTVSIISPNGNRFSFTGAEDYAVGDIVACVMSDKGTSNVRDDVVLEVRYQGTREDIPVSFNSSNKGTLVSYDNGEGFYIGE